LWGQAEVVANERINISLEPDVKRAYPIQLSEYPRYTNQIKDYAIENRCFDDAPDSLYVVRFSWYNRLRVSNFMIVVCYFGEGLEMMWYLARIGWKTLDTQGSENGSITKR